MGLLKNIKRKYRKVKYKSLLNFCFKNDYKVIFPPQGLGDILILLMGLKNFKKKHPSQKIAIVVTKKHFKDLCEIFVDRYDKLLYFPKLEFAFDERVLDIAKEIYGPESHFDKFEEAILETIGITEKNDVTDLPKIPINTKVTKLFSEGKYLKGKTVLIAPEATTSQDCFPPNYWLDCADKLKAKGYIPVFNSNKKFGEYDSILLNLQDTINFVNYAGNVLSFRSGLIDVLGCFCDAKQVIIYPNNCKVGTMSYLNGYDDSPNEKYMEDGSLNRLYPHKTFVEFIYNGTIDVTSYFEDLK